MSDRPSQGLLDTSVVVDLELIDPSDLPEQVAIAAITLAELSAGPAAARTAEERARRQDRLQRVEAVFDPIPFDLEAARAYGRIHAAVVASGRRSRDRFADLLIASTALAADLPLLTRNPDDFTGLAELVDVRTV